MKSFNEFRNVQLDEATQQSHKVSVTVSDPHHTMVSMRKEKIEKRVIVKAADKDEARAKAEAFYKKKGYKVHDSFHHSVQPATSLKTEEVEHLDEEGTPTGIKIYHTTKEGKPTHGIVFTPHDARTYEKEVKSSGGKVTHRAVMYGKTEGEKHAVKEGVEIAEDTLEEATLAQKAYKLGKFHRETGFTGPNPHKDSSADVKAAYNKGLKEEAVEEGFENLPGKATHILNKDVRHLDHGIVANGTVLRKTGEDTYEIRAGRAKGKIAKIGKDHVNKLEEGHVPAERNRPDLSAGDKDKLGKLAALIAKEKAKKAAKQVNETAYEKDMDDKKPVVAHGVKGMKSTPFSKKFKSMAHYEKWADSEDAGNHEVHRVVQEEVDQIVELKKSTLGSYIKKASSQAAEAGAAGDELSAGQKAEKNKPEAGSKMYALRRKREAGVQTAMGKLTKEDVDQIDELNKATLGSYIKKATDDVSYHSFSAGSMSEKDPERSKVDAKAFKRQKGVEKATDRLTKEETEMSQMEQYLAAISGNVDFRSALDEKKLTSAELKKREEIAQAMERENPGIDMGKKMAIATAQAKKVAEEANLEEKVEPISGRHTIRQKDQFPAPREQRPNGGLSKSEKIGPDGKIYHWQDPRGDVKEETDLNESRGFTKPRDHTEIDAREYNEILKARENSGQKNHRQSDIKTDSVTGKVSHTRITHDGGQAFHGIPGIERHYDHATGKSKYYKQNLVKKEELEIDEASRTPEERLAIAKRNYEAKLRSAQYPHERMDAKADYDHFHAAMQKEIAARKQNVKEEVELEEGYGELTKRAPLRMKVAAAQKMKGDTPDNEKEKSLAKLAKPYDKVTHADVLKGRGVTKEETEMKSYSQLMAELEEAKKDDYWDFKDLPKETSSGVRKVAGTRYGGASQKDEPENDEEGKEEPAKRGRPAGSKSGARR